MLRRGGRTLPSLRRALLVLPFWVFSVAWMWIWWLLTLSPNNLGLFSLLTIAMLYEFTALPSLFLYFVIKAKVPQKRIAPKDKRVAVISPCVPSTESLDIVENQLKAMSEIKYPHDSWILDEGNNKDIKKLARKYGVKYFSRRGVRKYNQKSHPFQKKTKAGNVNAWLDHVKWRRYEYFVQLDIDHIPNPNYLNKTLGYFRDPNVAWVQAPSVYKNLEHWTSRGAAEQELVLQGPLQMGFYGHSNVPFIIGSHCTYRMSAIREIGGFQPTRAEDHLDTVFLANKGYSGVFLPEIIARGDGPETLSTYLAQQFAWAYSMFQVLLSYTPKLIKEMSWRRRLQFIFAQTWYPLWSLSYLILFLSPVIALWLNREIVTVNGQEMLLHFIPMFIGGFLIWITAKPIMQPKNVRLSWRGIILHAVRWPIILRAILSATFKIKKPYMITPKGSFAKNVPVLKTYIPFLILGFISSISVIINSYLSNGYMPESQIVFALSNTGFMFSICAIDISLRLRQLKPKWPEIKLYWLKPIAATTSLAMLLIIGTYTPLLIVGRQPVLAQRDSLIDVGVKQVNNDMNTSELVHQISLIERSNDDLPSLGMYNKEFNLPNSNSKYIQHSFVDWRDTHYLALTLAKSLQSGNTPLITIEPSGIDDGNQLLNEINSGIYDVRLQRISNIIGKSKNDVYIRFAHEMDLANLYPWGNQIPQKYIDAFNHTSSILKSNNNNVKMVWAPAGNYGADAYYPGDTSVDVIGVTILYDQYWYGSYLPSFKELSYTRSWLFKLNKPMWVVEFGVGNAIKENQKILISDAIENYKNLGFQVLVYLNLQDANIEGPDYRLNSINDFGNLFNQRALEDTIIDESLGVVDSSNSIKNEISIKPNSICNNNFYTNTNNCIITNDFNLSKVTLPIK